MADNSTVHKEVCDKVYANSLVYNALHLSIKRLSGVKLHCSKPLDCNSVCCLPTSKPLPHLHSKIFGTDETSDDQPSVPPAYLSKVHSYLPTQIKQIIAQLLNTPVLRAKHDKCSHQWGCVSNILEVSAVEISVTGLLPKYQLDKHSHL